MRSRICCTSAALQLLDMVDQKLLGATGQHVFCFLVAPITNVEHQDLTIESSLHPIVNTSGFLPVMLNIDMSGAR